ncbi:hypothetical protein ANDA3_2182 [plant metagenome]|uniref:Uncharacterized protein n=1 Tax=plant metagenome TaxID=1297885 RepID=A0A484QQ66_9ZZZZ
MGGVSVACPGKTGLRQLTAKIRTYLVSGLTKNDDFQNRHGPRPSRRTAP